MNALLNSQVNIMTDVETDISLRETTSIKTDISLSQSLLEQVETLAQEMQTSRNQVFILAIQDFMARHRQDQQFLEQINKAYEDEPDEEERAQLSYMRGVQRDLLVEDKW
jgi:predicted transcriptional regulator